MIINKLKTPLSLLCLSAVLLACNNEMPEDAADRFAWSEYRVDALETEQQLIYHFLLAEIAINRRDYHAAMEQYIILTQATQDPIIAARATSLALEQRLYDEAGMVVKVWADNTIDDPQTQGIAISILLKNKDIKSAMPYLDRIVVEDDETTFKNLVFVQSTLENTEDYEQFIILMRKHGKEKNDFRSTFMSAQAALDIGELDAALETIDQVLALQPDWIRPVALKIQILYETGQQEQAIAYLNEATALFPNNSSLKWLQAQMLLDSGQLQEGERIMQGLKQDASYGDDANIELARVAIQQGQYKKAGGILDNYLKQPNITQADTAFYLSAFSAQQLGNLDAALVHYRKVQQGPYFVNANIQVALIYAQSGYTDMALETLDPIIQLYPQERSRLELVKTQILLDAYRIEEAYDELSRVITNKTSDTELRYIRGLIAIELEKTKEAETDFRYVISQQPTHLEAINDLTALLINTEDYKDAMNYAEQAIDLEPSNPEALANMGWLQHKLGNNQEALESLQKAYDLDPQPETAERIQIIQSSSQNP